jgi:hypothetical protein
MGIEMDSRDEKGLARLTNNSSTSGFMAGI